MNIRKRTQSRNRSTVNPDITDEDIYLMVCLHTYQHMSCEKIARRFGLPQGRVKDIIARRSNSGCCG